MKKTTIRDITTTLQTIGHDGYADCEICIKVHDRFYRVGKISRAVVHGETTREVFTIEAESYE
jgi:hypothetical protein